MDVRSEYVQIASQIAGIYGLSATFLHQAASADFLLNRNDRYDVTLCFSMLQWVIAQHGLQYGIDLLKAISDRSRALFFDVSVNIGKACLSCRPGDELVFVHDLLRKATSYRNIRHVGDVHPYGSDTRHMFYCSH
jgi:hypothetical protein